MTPADRELARRCRWVFRYFVRAFWTEVPGAAPLQWNWHLDVLANTVQESAERVFAGLPREDLVINVPPGTSKSSIISILFHCWVWAVDPARRFLAVSHTDSLAMDLAGKARDVLEGELFGRLFPHVRVRGDRSAKGDYATTAGGDRLTGTVAGKSPTGRHAHFQLCLPGETPIITTVGILPIGAVVGGRLPVRVLGYDHAAGRPVWRSVAAYERNPGRPLCRICFSDGRSLEATAEHPVYVVGRGYVPAADLRPGDEVFRVEQVPELREAGAAVAGRGPLPARGLLPRGLPAEAPQEGRHGALRGVWETALPGTEGPESGQAVFLLARVLCQGAHGAGAPPLQPGREEVRGVWQGDAGLPGHPAPVLLLPLQGAGHPRGEQPVLQAEGPGGVRAVRLRGGGAAVPGGLAATNLLLAGVCEPGPLRADAGDGELQLRPRAGVRPLRSGLGAGQETGPRPGRPAVLPLPGRSGAAGTVRPDRGGPPRRLGQDEQRPGEPRDPLCPLPPQAGGQAAAGIVRAVVASVTAAVRVPEAVYNLRVAGTRNYFAGGILVHNCDDPLDPKKALSEVELKAANDFMTQTLPSRKVNKAVDVTVLIMQRLHEEDPAGQALRMAKEEGSVPVRHVCLPAELEPDGLGGWLPGNVSPPELAARYADGLLDPVRLPRPVLRQFRLQLGVYAYSGQFLQRPSPPGGGMFEAAWFSRRVKAAPYDAKRVRYFDVAATTSSLNPGACFTAGVLMARGDEGRYYVEHVERGQWEPHERNARIRATARRDRARYGPQHEPRIYVERQPGSAGKDAWIAVAKILDGFPCHEDPVTGDKATRAEPFTGPLSAGLVSLVDDGTWDCESYVHEFLLFPLGRLCDQVDATSGAYNRLAQGRTQLGMRVLSFRQPGTKFRHPQLVVTTTAALEALEVGPQHRCLLVTAADPGASPPPTPKGFVCLDAAHIPFADLEPDAYQDRWGEPVPPTGLLPEQLLLDRDGGKKFWACLLKKREPPADVYVFASPGGRRAATLAYAAADVLRVPRDKIHWEGNAPPDNKLDAPPPCPHAYAAVKAARGYVAV